RRRGLCSAVEDRRGGYPRLGAPRPAVSQQMPQPPRRAPLVASPQAEIGRLRESPVMASSMPEPLPRELSPGGFARRAGGLVLVGLVVALLISTLPGLDEVRHRFAHAEPGWLVALFFREVASCLSYVVAFRGVFCKRLTWRFSYEIGMAEQGTNVLVPAGGVGGLALGAWALRQGGMST